MSQYAASRGATARQSEPRGRLRSCAGSSSISRAAFPGQNDFDVQGANNYPNDGRGVAAQLPPDHGAATRRLEPEEAEHVDAGCRMAGSKARILNCLGGLVRDPNRQRRRQPGLPDRRTSSASTRTACSNPTYLDRQRVLPANHARSRQRRAVARLRRQLQLERTLHVGHRFLRCSGRRTWRGAPSAFARRPTSCIDVEATGAVGARRAAARVRRLRRRTSTCGCSPRSSISSDRFDVGLELALSVAANWRPRSCRRRSRRFWPTDEYNR